MFKLIFDSPRNVFFLKLLYAGESVEIGVRFVNTHMTKEDRVGEQMRKIRNKVMRFPAFWNAT